MTDDNRVVADQDLLDQKAHDSLTLVGVECFRRDVEPGKERRECLGEP